MLSPPSSSTGWNVDLISGVLANTLENMICGRQKDHPPKMPMSYFPKLVNVTLHGKGDITDMIKLMILRWRDYLGRPHGISRVIR